MNSQKKLLILVASVLVVGLIGTGVYMNWRDNRFEESDELAAQEADRIIDPIDVAPVMDASDNLSDIDESKNVTADDEEDQSDSENGQSQSQPQPEEMMVVQPQRYTGTWQSSGSYRSSGGIEIVEQGDDVIIQTTADYSFSGAPDPFLYLSSDQSNSIANAIPIGKLQKNDGAQAYRVSKEEFEQYNGSLVLWCEAFSLYMGRADIQPS